MKSIVTIRNIHISNHIHLAGDMNVIFYCNELKTIRKNPPPSAIYVGYTVIKLSYPTHGMLNETFFFISVLHSLFFNLSSLLLT